MFGALSRLFSSSTWLAGVLSIIVQLLCAKNGIPLPPELLAAVPLGVAWKEGKRREVEPELVRAKAIADSALRLRELKPSSPP